MPATPAEARAKAIILAPNEDRPLLARMLAEFFAKRFGDGTSGYMWNAFLVYAAVVERCEHAPQLPCYDAQTATWLSQNLGSLKYTPSSLTIPEITEETAINLATYTFHGMEDDDYLVIVANRQYAESLASLALPHSHPSVRTARVIESCDAVFQVKLSGQPKCLKYRNHACLQALSVAAQFLWSKIRG